MNIAAVKRSYEEVKGPIQAVVKKAPEEDQEITVRGYGVLQDVSSWRIFTPEIDVEKCIGCKACWIFCPETAISWEEDKPLIEYRKCKGCGMCANECTVEAIEMVRVEA
jgi:pyruvate ferredoxin oxidoreductase delta subunit